MSTSTALPTAVPMLLVAAGGAVALGWRLKRRAAANRYADVDAGLDFTIDLIAVVLGSGGTIRQGIATVASNGPAAVRSAFRAVLAGSEAGMLLADAMTPASHHLGPAYHPLIGALIATERDGAPVSVLLQTLADEAEQARRWRAEALAKRLPVSLLVPLVVCLLPAAIAGAVAPLVIVALRQLSG